MDLPGLYSHFGQMDQPVSFRRSSFLRMGVLLIAVPIAFELGSFAVLLGFQRSAATADQWTLHSREVLRQAVAADRLLVDAHSAARALAIFQTETFEQEDRGAVERWPAAIAALRDAVSDNPPQQAQLDRIRDRGLTYLDWYRRQQALAERGAWERYRQEFLSLTGKTLLDATNAEMNRFTAEEQRLERLRIDNLARARARQRWGLLSAAIVSTIVTFAVMMIFAKAVHARIAHLARNAHSLAGGEPLLPLLPGTDEIAGLDAVLHDSSARLRAAADAERAYSAEIERQRDRLQAANRELALKTQENEMFVYSVSHDLRSPLVNLEGFTRELADSCDDLTRATATLPIPEIDRARLQRILASDVRESIAFIRTAVGRLSAIVDALLRLSRAGKVQYAPAAVELNGIVDTIVKSLRITADEKRAAIEVAPLPTVYGDRTAVEQVFQNLLANALNYLDPRRPGRIRIHPQPAARDGYACIVVEDNGLGIAAAHMRKLFTPFERLHGSAAKGEGIGLALVKRVVDRHGGRIWAESTAGQGSRFFLELPVRPVPAAETARAASHA
jgi:signal transduction histidine kinase